MMHPVSFVISRYELEINIIKCIDVPLEPYSAYNVRIRAHNQTYTTDARAVYCSYQNNKSTWDGEGEEPRVFTLKEGLWFCMTSLTPQVKSKY